VSFRVKKSLFCFTLTAPSARCVHFNVHDSFPTGDDRNEADDEVKDFVWGGSDDAPTEDDRDDADDEVEDFVWGGSEKTPQKSK
jgi:hypothetical protein